ncbi:hypothetical protein AOC36_01410 [Erysipelothrix larvae]|uniref:Permease IIC component n=1 Tax=Erysipelothrix larvae TaxID=1514105 RepID=A0A0X8GYC7_9FIRM|nr:PTS transporter subunit EIIC [Erysipelothrix larvae]AMC92692.1 hypothetical protein AOC36_01410 [Erysipelothrix larvae]
MSGIGQFVDEKIVPFAAKISENTVVKAIQYGAMATMPLTLGVSLLAILLNLPFEAWTTWLTTNGIDVHLAATIKVTMEIAALYMSFMIGYNNTALRGRSGVTGGIISLAAFLILAPQTIAYDGGVVAGLNFDYLGSNGIFGGMIVAVIISSLFVYLDKKGIVVKLPESVPPMVSQSLSPTFIAIIIFTGVFFVRVGFGMTQYGNFYDFITTVLGQPIVNLGTSLPSVLALLVLINVFWFFGIHPMTLLSVYMPVLMTVGQANLTAFMAGETMPYLAFSASFAFYAVGGTGNTLGLALIIPFIAKSERYKALGKLSVGPSLFNINEPFIFGLPIMLNPLFLTPMVATSIVNTLLGYLAYTLGVFNTLNPTISLPWIMPAFITPFFTIGFAGVLTVVLIIVVDALIYYPFFRKADNLAYEEENQPVESARTYA